MRYFSEKRIVRHVVMGALLASTVGLTAGCRESGDARAAEFAFRNAVTDPPPGTERFFQLSADYPATLPASCDGCEWLKINVDFADQPAGKLPRKWESDGWSNYLKAILTYVREDQDDNLANDIGFKASVKGKTRWFNVPWMAFDPTAGREYLHGATNERTLKLSAIEDGSDLDSSHKLPGTSAQCDPNQGYESWSVGYYNDFGGYALGKAIPRAGPNAGAPQLSAAGDTLDGLPFPEGTAVVKILTTSATPDCVPFLEGSPQWTVDRHKSDPAGPLDGGFSCEREPQVSRIVQVDVAVRDNRSPSGWVYGTYAYNNKMPGTNFWDKLMPMGLQWGGDPTVFPAGEQTDPKAVQQTVLYEPDPDVKIFEHGGCNGRLAGPADNVQSSCVSCHSSAFSMTPGVVPVMGTNVPPSFGFPGICKTPNADNTAYFATIRAPARYSDPKYASAISLDTSLQLAVAMRQYAQFATTGGAAKCVDQKKPAPKT